MNDPNCIFCRIATAQIPAARVFENERAVAILDISPLAEGHLLLIPKQHVPDIRGISPADLGELTGVLPRLVTAVMNATGATGANVLQNTGASSGQAVFHLHFHIIPRVESDALGYRWNAGTYAAGRAEAIKEAVIQNLSAP
ncbi:MAG: HIT family protein [Phycisphaerae bacterium]|nr:HIT family protein [Phycisphaerae bacterium]